MELDRYIACMEINNFDYPKKTKFSPKYETAGEGNNNYLHIYNKGNFIMIMITDITLYIMLFII